MIELKDIIDHWFSDNLIEHSSWTHVWYDNDVQFTCSANGRLIMLYGNKIRILKNYGEYEITKVIEIDTFDDQMFNRLKDALNLEL